MKILLDTNILIPLEPTSPTEIEAETRAGAALLHEVHLQGHETYLHPLSARETEKDRDPDRRAARRILSSKYPLLPNPPSLSASIESRLDVVFPDSHDYVDHHLLEALLSDAVDILVTEDKEIFRKAAMLGLADRVYATADATTYLAGLRDVVVLPPPAVRHVKVHVIPLNDPILDSFRADYPDWDSWFRQCRREHRQAWVIGTEGEQLSAITLVKPESDEPYRLEGSVLKICSFKVAEWAAGEKYGELLLKAVFLHAIVNAYSCLYVEIYPKYSRLIRLFNEFGFTAIDTRTSRDEFVLVKPLMPDPDALRMKPLDYHIRYGPHWFQLTVPWYLIPIQPKYVDALFPELAEQHDMFVGRRAFGNTIKKAYLCNSPSRQLSSGAVLAFYQSQSRQALVALGITEQVFMSEDSVEIVKRVGKRTVYPLREVELLCRKHVLAILFRQVMPFNERILVKDLIAHGVFSKPPQSIMQIRSGLEWLKSLLVT